MSTQRHIKPRFPRPIIKGYTPLEYYKKNLTRKGRRYVNVVIDYIKTHGPQSRTDLWYALRKRKEYVHEDKKKVTGEITKGLELKEMGYLECVETLDRHLKDLASEEVGVFVKEKNKYAISKDINRHYIRDNEDAHKYYYDSFRREVKRGTRWHDLVDSVGATVIFYNEEDREEIENNFILFHDSIIFFSSQE